MTAKPIKNAQTMDAVWISGTLNASYSGSPWGSSEYKMKADLIVPYTRRRIGHIDMETPLRSTVSSLTLVDDCSNTRHGYRHQNKAGPEFP